MFRNVTLVIGMFAGVTSLAASAAFAAPVTTLLDARFAPREIRQIEVGDFHFVPGQKAPVHTHAAPAYGYVSKGTILYQIEGQPMRTLHAGEAFFEPVGPRIVHFDNASPTDEAVFTDFNPERAGDPFIVFPTPPTEAIDRRPFPTTTVAPTMVSRVVATARTLRPGATLRTAATFAPTTGYVVAGNVEIRAAGSTSAVATGATFALPAGTPAGTIANPSATTPARIVTFDLR